MTCIAPMLFSDPVKLTAFPEINRNNVSRLVLNHDATVLAYTNYVAGFVVIQRQIQADGRVPEPLHYTDLGVFARSPLFVLRNGIETLMVCDPTGNCLVELCMAATFIRNIGDLRYSPFDISYCKKTDVIAVCESAAHRIKLLRYDTGEAFRQIGVGFLHFIREVCFVEDGDVLAVSDYFNNRICRFRAVDGELLGHVNVKSPLNVIPYEDGLLCLSQDALCTDLILHFIDSSGSVTRVCAFPFGTVLVSSPNMCGVLHFPHNGEQQFLPDTWHCSTRGAWLGALCI